MSTKPKGTEVASPAATGGGGGNFEQHVQTFMLSHLLMRTTMPIARNAVVREVHLQAERMGFCTDDVVVVGEETDGTVRRLVAQMKRSFVVSASDDDCRKTIGDFWSDFRKPELLTPAHDALVLITRRATKTLLDDFGGLLDAARASSSTANFMERLEVTGVVTKKAKQGFDEVRAILHDIEERDISDAEMWLFLRMVHILPLDLHTSASLTEADTKSLLAFVGGLDAEEASNVWTALLAEVSTGNPAGASYTWEQLPEGPRKRFAGVAKAKDRDALSRLQQHSRFVLDEITSSIGGNTVLPRVSRVQHVLEALRSAQVIFVTGTAGAGKSAVAKAVVGEVATHEPVFAFRAEEFACAHVDEVLRAAQTSLTGAMLGVLLSGNGRKVILVESVERLLEASVRRAFFDLLTLAKRDPSIRLLFTCRDYAVESVRAALLRGRGLDDAVVDIGVLDEDELKRCAVEHPSLERPLSVPRLHSLLKNPFVLDKALLVRWDDGRTLPQNEREFRQLFWKDVIRVEAEAADGMPARREDVLKLVALSRARALTEHVEYTAGDAAALARLVHAAIISERAQGSRMVAPAHDVLEDWAVLRWLDDEHLRLGVTGLPEVVGAYPALRRSFRIWVGELIEHDIAAAGALFDAAVAKSIPPQFGDDVLVALLRANDVAKFLLHYEKKLLGNDAEMLRRVIFLMRIACVARPGSSGGVAAPIAHGPAWAAVLELVDRNASAFADTDDIFILHLVEDWSGLATSATPYPDGARAASAIVSRIAARLRSELQTRALRVAVQIPNETSAFLAATLKADVEDDLRKRLVSVLLDHRYNDAACRDMPDVVMSVARETWLIDDDEKRENARSNNDSIMMEAHFGLSPRCSMRGFPPSALRGPTLALLRHHGSRALKFVVEIVNRCIRCYATAPKGRRLDRRPKKITLFFSDGTSVKQWNDGRSWTHYRGFGNGPHVLESLLMALEQYLLELCASAPTKLDEVLLGLLRESTSIAITAVVAAVATADPGRAVETLLVLLRCRECIDFDRSRMVWEGGGHFFKSGLREARIYDDERRRSGQLPHRRRQLEHAVFALQRGSARVRVQQVLDELRSALKANDHLWDLALQRMDLRFHTVRAARPDEIPPELAAEGCNVQVVSLEAKGEQLQKMMSEAAAHAAESAAHSACFAWGVARFDRRDDGAFPAEQWAQHLAQAQALRLSSTTELFFDRQAPGFVAAVCVRDHWQELDREQRAWCGTVLCEELTHDADDWERATRDTTNMRASRAAARTISLLLVADGVTDEMRQAARAALYAALTHPCFDVRLHVSWGLGEVRPGGIVEVTRCANAVCLFATRFEERYARQLAEGRGVIPRLYQAIGKAVATDVRAALASKADGEIPSDAFASMELTTRSSWKALRCVLAMHARLLDSPMALAVIRRLAVLVVKSWNAGRDDREMRTDEHVIALAYELPRVLLFMPSQQAVALATELVKVNLDAHADKLAEVFERIINEEDTVHIVPSFWALWDVFAKAVRSVSKHTPGVEQLEAALLLSVRWNEEAREWLTLEGEMDRVHQLFEALPASGKVFHAYLRFLYYVGSSALPSAFLRLAAKLRAGDLRTTLDRGSNVGWLEELLVRHVYLEPQVLKRDATLRAAVLELLDVTIKYGSSTGFLMRDDFVTPGR